MRQHRKHQPSEAQAEKKDESEESLEIAVGICGEIRARFLEVSKSKN
jgi:hypothetical protein